MTDLPEEAVERWTIYKHAVKGTYVRGADTEGEVKVMPVDAAPAIRKQERERVRELLDFWEIKHQRVAEGPPGDFDVKERQRARGAVELGQRLKGSLDTLEDTDD